ncbi:hypothetical protein [Naasia sp. SYSU D00057]|uniref:hypothetical protein n=1 Tax=Naasia sp. SYSU D00057 TaxID=2817380 RepID=UPI001B30A189|nr:hypothetical protein [Naasia sp. SYSU D00057]
MTLVSPRSTLLTFPLGSGSVSIDQDTGSPVQFTDDRAPERTFLLDESVPWHSVEHSWGSGHLIGDGWAARWNAPSELVVDEHGLRATHRLSERIEVTVERHGGDVFREVYRFRNISREPVRLTSIGIQTPFADLYQNAEDALSRRVHAHLFTGGTWAWALAQPMAGDGRLLGLIVREGAVHGYSVETRNANSISNARGHIVLQVTDAARNAGAFGGQPVLELAPDGDYTLAWELSWYDDVDEFLAATSAPARFSAYAVPLGEHIDVLTAQAVAAEKEVTIAPIAGGVRLTAHTPGSYRVSIGADARTEVLFHADLETTVTARSSYVLAHQRTTERQGLLANAIVPVDTSTRLTQATNGWSDWTDGSERIGVALMLHYALARGWVAPEVDDFLEGWSQFARVHLLDGSAAPRRGSQDHSGTRLYDSPWLARFFVERFRWRRNPDDLELAARILERALELGIGRFLAIGYSEACVAVADRLAEDGQTTRAQQLRNELVRSARYFIAMGTALPAHEVAYEQAMVGPLVSLLIDAHRISGDPDLLPEISTRLRWLLAFGGPQPHARLQGVAIRHWDGYWFGRRRQWGDVFPHYWSVLTSTVLARLPDPLRTAETEALAGTILRANMSNYFPDGSATCAFVFPTAVDGEAAHVADPLANDQDWHLAIWMDLDAQDAAPS